MKKLSRNRLSMFVLSGMLALGVASASFVVAHAETSDNNANTQVEQQMPMPPAPPQMDTDKLAEMMSKNNGLEQSVIKELLDEKYSPMDIDEAAIIAKASDKNVKNVLNKKKINNSWDDVATECGMSADDFHKAHINRGPGFGPCPDGANPEGACPNPQGNNPQQANCPQGDSNNCPPPPPQNGMMSGPSHHRGGHDRNFSHCNCQNQQNSNQAQNSAE